MVVRARAASRIPRRSIDATCRPPRHSARNPLRASTCQPGPPGLRVTETVITGSPVPASSRIALARKRPSFSSMPMIDRDGPALGEEPPLGREIAAHAAVPVEMVGREVEEDRDVGLQRPGELDLVGGELQHHDHAVRGRVEVEHAAADVAADLHRPPGAPPARARASAVVVDLPFEPVMPTTCGSRSKLSQAGVANERKKSPMSLSTATPASQAAATAGCGAG